MSDINKILSEDSQGQSGQTSNKKSIRFVEESNVSDDQIPSGNFQKSVNTSRAVSDSTREGEDDQDIEDIIQENQSKFKHIKSIDIILPHCEEKLTELISPSKRVEKSFNASSVHSENQDDNLSVHFGGLEILECNEGELPKFEYEPDEVPIKSILKNDLNRSRNMSFDVRMLKDIEGKIISHDNLSENPDNDHTENDNGSRNSILKNCQFTEDTISQGRSQGSGVMNKSMDSNEDEDDYFQDDNQGDQKIEYRNRMDSEVRFKLNPIIQEASEKPIDTNAAKRNSLLFPAYSILKNSPLVQPSEFKTLKQIEKVSHHSHHNSSENIQRNVLSSHNESDGESEESQENEETDVRFVGDAILQDESAYRFKYNPEENPKRPIIKRGSCITHSQTPKASLSYYSGGFTPFSNVKSEHCKKKRMSYDFLNLKNVDGKVINHKQQKFLEETTLIDEQNREIKFGGFEILETDKLGDQAQVASKALRPQKPILKAYRGRSSSCDFKKPIKNIDGVYIRKNQEEADEVDEEEKVVHFGGVMSAEENQTGSANTNVAASKETKSITINLNLIRQYNSQNEQFDAEQHGEDSTKKSILKRSSSVQMRKSPLFISSNDNTPTTKKKSNFSNRKIEIKESLGYETPNAEIFNANWTSIRNDYLESALKFLIRIDTKCLPQIFQHGMDAQIFNQIIEVLHSRTEDDILVRSYMENLFKIKNFESLLFINKHQQENIQEILDMLEGNHSIDGQTYQDLCSIYILKKQLSE